MVLKWIGGGKVDHPMADARQAREIVDALPAGDPAKALQEITEWLESLNRTDGFRLDRRFENVDLLDAAAKGPLRKLAQDYLSTPRQQKFQEHRLWNGIHEFWVQLGEAYLRCVHEHETGMSGASAVRKQLPVIAARGLRALAMQLKWTLLRYGPVEPRLWSDLSRLFQLAERKGFAQEVVAIYPGAHGASSTQRELLRALMLCASSTDGLHPQRQEIAERVVAHFAESFRLSAQAEGCTHCFDLAAPRAPARLYKGAAPSPTMRFFGAGEALARLERLAAQVGQTGAPPSDVNLGGSYHKDVIAGVLGHLAQYWSDNPPARSSERRPTAGRITVVPGLQEVLGALDPSAGSELDFSDQSSAESWIVENASEGGYGAIIPAQKSDWIRVGALVGVQGENSKHWGLGLIRRIARDEHQQRRVGMQLLTRAAIPIRISKPGAPEREPAILLSTAPDARGEVGVVMRGGLYNGRDSLEMRVREKSYLLLPSRMVEMGDDFDWARFKVMQRSP
ncbi:MAG TPA: hypothetical protein VNK67_03160 [Burkholderiales bacterium]|nr:hypothetical protein [Burkholderiales bacterium]